MSAAQRQREVSDPTATIRRRLAHLLALGAVRAARATSEGAGEPEPEDSTTNHTKGVDHGQR